MLPIQFRKLLGDIRKYKDKFLIMLVAMVVSLFAVTVIMTTTSIASREINVNYLQTNPAHATFEVDKMSVEILDQVKEQELVKQAEMRDMISFQVLGGDGKWYGLRTFVVEDYNAMEVARFYPESGAWSPREGEILLERAAPEVLGLQSGESIQVKNTEGQIFNLEFTGLVHDPSLSPAWQDLTGYSYISTETYRILTGSEDLHDLKIVFRGEKLTQRQIKDYSRTIADMLETEGVNVKEVMVPPPYEHPHQRQMQSILSMLIIFGYLAIVLSAILTANLVSALLAREVRQIGIMKSIGASSGQILSTYTLIITVIGITAVILSLVPGMMIGRSLAAYLCGLLNFEMTSDAIDGWVFLELGFSGLFIPLAACLFPVLRNSRITVKAALSDKGIATVDRGRQRSVFMKRLPAFMQMSIRNVFRKRKKLLLSLLLLSTAGAMFMSSRNADLAWSRKVESFFEKRAWDGEVRLTELGDRESVTRILLSRPEIDQVDSSLLFKVMPSTEGSYRISEVYPDGGHGLFMLRTVNQDQNPFDLKITRGSFFQEGGEGQILLSQTGIHEFPGAEVGDKITLDINGVKGEWTLQGVFEEIGPNLALVTENEMSQLLNLSGQANSFFIHYSDKLSTNESELMETLQNELIKNGYKAQRIISKNTFRQAIDGHLFIILYAILGLGFVLAVVGVLGLSSSMTTTVLERKGEIGVLKTLGGSNGIILFSFILESLIITLLSILGAVFLSLFLSYYVGNNLGMLSFEVPLSLAVSLKDIGLWSIAILMFSTIATLFPAMSAVELTISKALAYE